MVLVRDISKEGTDRPPSGTGGLDIWPTPQLPLTDAAMMKFHFTFAAPNRVSLGVERLVSKLAKLFPLLGLWLGRHGRQSTPGQPLSPESHW
jgi:hypothetical protein